MSKAKRRPAMQRHMWAAEAASEPGKLWVRPVDDSDCAGTPYLFTSKRVASFWGRPIKVRLFLEDANG